jgi:hypothetical protein
LLQPTAAAISRKDEMFRMADSGVGVPFTVALCPRAGPPNSDSESSPLAWSSRHD